MKTEVIMYEDMKGAGGRVEVERVMGWFSKITCQHEILQNPSLSFTPPFFSQSPIGSVLPNFKTHGSI